MIWSFHSKGHLKEIVKHEINFRERHAKTLEIAQEEVLTCLGICIAERLHKVHRRLREEETVCKVLAAVAIDALSRNFQVIKCHLSYNNKCSKIKHA